MCLYMRMFVVCLCDSPHIVRVQGKRVGDSRQRPAITYTLENLMAASYSHAVTWLNLNHLGHNNMYTIGTIFFF